MGKHSGVVNLIEDSDIHYYCEDGDESILVLT